MKYRIGFVSNSSSASFIVSFKTNLSRDNIEKMIIASEPWFQDDWDNNDPYLIGMPSGDLYIRNKDRLKENSGQYTLVCDTVCFNDWYDVSAWSFIRALAENKIPNIQLIEIHQVYECYDECDNVVQFDAQVWEKTHRVRRGAKRQRELNREYRKYLSTINKLLSGII